MYKFIQKSQKTSHRQLTTLLAGLLLACILLLSACSGGSTGTKATTAHATSLLLPTLSPALQQQGSMQLDTFQQWISLMQQYGGNVDHYKQLYTSDQQALTAAKTDNTYQTTLSALNDQVATIKLPALKAEALSLQQKMTQEASTWTGKHTYYDSYNGTTYNLGYEYAAIANYPTQDQLDTAQTVADYQYAIGQLNNSLANFQAYQKNFNDNTPYNQIHQTDTQLMQTYGDMTGQTLVVSLSEQAMRVYQDGKLVNSFQVVTGMPDHPSLPGSWWIETRQTNIQFTSGKQPGQEGYYPPTPIAFAMQYHSDGYFIHESWWRSQYGPTMQFPHIDSGGTSFADQGSHGCVNMSTATVQWLYNNVTVGGTKLVIY